MIDRRTFLAGAGVALLAAPRAAEAQVPGTLYRIGVLLPLGVTPPILATFLGGMRERGWVENHDFVAEPRYAEGKLERLPELAAALVRLARPGGNITGMSLYGPEVCGKGIELLKEAVPRAQRVMITRDPSHNSSQALGDAAADTAANTLGIRLHRVDVRQVSDYDAAFAVAVKERVDAVLISPSSPLPKGTADFALRHPLPTITLMGSIDQVGQLIAYGANFRERVRRVTTYVDRILKGAKPADLPVEQPTHFGLVINLKAAKALGLTIPPSLLARADQVIQ